MSNHVGEVWEYIEDGMLYLVLPDDEYVQSFGRYRLLNLQNGNTATITTTAFIRPAVMKRWRRFT